MLEVHRDIVASNIRGHCHNWGCVELPYQMASRDSVKVWHDDIHENQVVLRACIHFVDSFQSIELGTVSTVRVEIHVLTYSTINGAVEGV